MKKCFRHIRPKESQQTKEAILHFSLMRCLVLASTLGPLTGFQQLGILLLWLSSIAFLRGVVTMCKCRFDYLMAHPIPKEVDIYRVSWVLTTTIVVNLALVFVWSCNRHFSYLTVHFAYFEASLLLLKATQLGVKIIYNIFDLDNSPHEFNVKGKKGSKCSSLARIQSFGFSSLKLLKTIFFDGFRCMLRCGRGEYYLLVTQMGLSGCYLVQLLVYYLYILSTDQFRISFLDLILILNVKNAIMEVVERYRKISIYKHAAMELDEQFPSASIEDLAANLDDVCVICLKPMSVEAKKLHCGHLLHGFCLRQCLQKQSVDGTFTHRNRMGRRHHNDLKKAMRCPLCRQNIYFSKEVDTVTNENPSLVLSPEEPRANRSEPLTLPPAEEVIRFSTERLARWLPLPSLSFEILRHRDPLESPIAMQQMTHQVLDMFPQYSPEQVQRDLMQSRSATRTIENILNGRLQDSPLAIADEDTIFTELRTGIADLWSSIWSGNQSSQTSQGHRR
uniref:Uncharacterized protein AlNc14C171G8017 n=1 Tax=Albugo laibachii Nc14 TaxID=890382 RepID=F0WEK2_9STRA|nr:conserved hypothetical protein [Albugo laibachii Nc14]CCA22884.1 conserved hypothetical protein [Albugo laibachii Nc14]|eukprot:CCA22884.1 conserved hypothetical protein [Albugo laibachii Nc14]